MNITPPTISQLALVILAAILFLVGAFAAPARLRRIATWAALLAVVGTLFCRYYATGSWLPLEDNFDTFVWMGLLLAGFVIHIQRWHPVNGLERFLFPIVAILLLGAAVFGKTAPHSYLPTTWSLVHRLTTFIGAVAFAVAAASGGMYLVANHRLRSKQTPKHKLGSLEQLERVTYAASIFGFALLTIGLVTGILRIINQKSHTNLGPHWYSSPKVVLTLAVYVVYGIVLHSRITPRLRGRTTAILSIVGFVLMVGAVAAVVFMPAGGR